jgi:hypothetical protein
MAWEKLPGIDGGHGGCLNCGYQHAVLPMEKIIAVGFGNAGITKDGECVWDEQEANGDFDACLTAAQAEDMAAKDPYHDWRIYLVAPLSERHYQRQGDKHWVLYEKGNGFA